jgi:hypothetical protein
MTLEKKGLDEFTGKGRGRTRGERGDEPTMSAQR